MNGVSFFSLSFLKKIRSAATTTADVGGHFLLPRGRSTCATEGGREGGRGRVAREKVEGYLPGLDGREGEGLPSCAAPLLLFSRSIDNIRTDKMPVLDPDSDGDDEEDSSPCVTSCLAQTAAALFIKSQTYRGWLASCCGRLSPKRGRGEEGKGGERRV